MAATCEDVSPEAEERILLEGLTKQSGEDRDWEHYLYVIVISKL
jgi:hypothetical protein